MLAVCRKGSFPRPNSRAGRGDHTIRRVAPALSGVFGWHLNKMEVQFCKSPFLKTRQKLDVVFNVMIKTSTLFDQLCASWY